MKQVKALSKKSLATSLIVSAVFLLVGCSGKQNGASSYASNNSRMIVSNSPLSLTNSSSGDATASALTVTLGLVATISPPSVGGVTLQANNIFMTGTRAFVAYNVAGDVQAGAVDSVNLLNTLLPIISSEATYPQMDVNSIYSSGTSVYAVGASSNGNLSGPSQIVGLDVTALLGAVLTGSQNFTLPSYAGTGIVGDATNLYAVSGDGGGLTVINKTSFVQSAYSAITDARGVAVAPSGLVYVVAGQPGRILEYSTAGVLSRTFSLGGAATPESKSTIVTGQTLLLATAGEGGVRVVCQANGQTLATIPAPTGVNGLPASKTVSNAAAAAPGLLFVANGEAGVYVYSMKSGTTVSGTNCKTVTTSLLGQINFGTSISANNIYYSGGSLFVASGLGGFKIVSVLTVAALGDTTDFN